MWTSDSLTVGPPDPMQDKDKADPLPHPNQRVPLAYENKKFLNGPDGRILRILAEYQEPLSKFRRERIQDTIVFFGSARFRSQEKAQAALCNNCRKLAVIDSEARERMQRAESDLDDVALLRRRAPAGLPDHQVDPDPRPAAPPLRGLHRRRPRHHGSGQPRRFAKPAARPSA